MMPPDVQPETSGIGERDPSSAFELEAAEVFPALGAPEPGDEQLIARLADRAIAGATAAAAGTSPIVAKALGGVVFGSLVMAVAVGLTRPSPAPEGAPAPERRGSGPSTPRVLPGALPAAEPPRVSEGVEVPAKSVRARRDTAPRKGPQKASDPEPAPDAGELLRRANAARQSGDHGRARALYHELGTRFPGTREEVLARVSLGNLELERFGQPAVALRHFDGYLEDQPRGNLAEEASLGRIRALGRLGQRERELEALRRFGAQFPGSVHGPEVERRLRKPGG